jgi:hypothetical protein
MVKSLDPIAIELKRAQPTIDERYGSRLEEAEEDDTPVATTG